MRFPGTPKLVMILSVVILLVLVAQGQTGRIGPPTSVDWPMFLFNSTHSSATSSDAITKSNVDSLIEAWHWQAGPPKHQDQPIPATWASPVVFNGTVYFGSDTGVFYALDLNTGRVIWQQFLGYRPKLTCHNKGISAPAAVALDPVTQKPTVYAPGGDGYLYALDAANGTINWKSVIALPSDKANDYYNWGSPNLVGGKIYVGVSAQCDNPLTDKTGVKEFDQATGNLLNQYFSIRPEGYEGGSIWSSVAVTSDSVFAAIGNPRPQGYPQGVTSDDISVVRIDPNSMARLDKWHLKTKPGSDQDFGAPPTVFSATLQGQPTEMVGVANKNGFFYALNSHNLSAGPVWTFRVSEFPITPTVAAAVWDGNNLYVAGNQIKLNGTKYQGSINKLDPATGIPVWQTPLESAVLGSPSLNGSGILAVATFESKEGVGTKAPNGTYLIDSATGSVLNYISLNDDYEWSQPIFAGNYLINGTKSFGGLFAYNPSSNKFSDGFESGKLSKWTKHANVKIEKTLAHAGQFAAEANATGNGAAYASTPLSSSQGDVTMNVYFYIKSLTTAADLVSFKDLNGQFLFAINVTAKGKLGSHNGITNKFVASPVSVSQNAWHLLQVHVFDAKKGQTSIRLDGKWIPILSKNQGFSGVNVKTVQFGDSSPTDTFDIVYDQVNVLAPSSK